ncbi:collagen binding domain-containing protein [Bacillus horti]|uniref:LPXTG-motif cell wall-anchored protein n=1 Tax=Caldalkalibacillus horti TaxID=77523 RepID=A0ABT9VTN3_9BACI|nr:collagen binding domain-containing protein [Bacillus horti]MDQ0164350.1 LPXTG-motif cell wall-anchored protein [Bacillus horti]
MRRKFGIVAIAFLLAFQTLLFGMTGIANQEGDPNGENPVDEETTVTEDVYASASNISLQALAPVQLTDIKLYYLDDDNTPIDVESPEAKTRLSRGENVRLTYTWSLPNSENYGEGDYYEFNLPTEFKLHSDILDEPLVFNGVDIGTFTVTESDNRVIMLFNDFVNSFSNIGGTLEVWSIINENLQSVTSEVEIYFPLFGSGKTIPIKLKPYGGSLISKSGEADRVYNGKEIIWTVDINTGLEEISNALVTDEIISGLELDISSIAVYRLNVSLDGDRTLGALVDSSDYTDSSAADTLEIGFGFGDIDSAYRIIYTTDITAEWEGSRSFQNTARLTGNGSINQTASATVSVSRGESLNKRSTNYDPDDHTITWEIQFNYNSRIISAVDAVLVDQFDIEQPSGQTEPLSMRVVGGLVPSSFVIYQITLNDDGGETGTPIRLAESEYSVEPNPDADGFVLRFNNENGISEPYKIVYQTQIVGKVFVDQDASNQVRIDGENRWRGEGVTLQQGILRKSNSGINYSAKTTNWRVTFNANEFDMEQVEFTDDFTNRGLQLRENTVTINGTPIGSTTHDLEPISGDYKNGFTITFDSGSTISSRYVIDYTTDFIPDERTNRNGNFTNRATLEWSESGSTPFTKVINAGFTPNDYTQNNGYKNGSYNAVTKEITWNVGFNYNLIDIDQAIVEDYFLSGQQLVPGSIEVSEMVIASDGDASRGASVTSGFTIDTNLTDGNNNPGFKISFENPIDTGYIITYRTTLDELLIVETYPNIAYVYDGSEELTRLSASVSVTHGTEYTHKEADYTSGVIVDWRIWINRGQSRVPAGAKIVDTPSDNQILLEDSFELYGTQVSSGGQVTKDTNNRLAEGVDYTLEILVDESGKETFELTFTNILTVPYVLEYQSFINARNNEYVSNTVEFHGQGIAVETTESEERIQVRLSGGSGTGSGQVGDLVVVKVDHDDQSIRLPNATFSLYFASNNRLIRTLETGADGTVTFENLLFTSYTLVEDEAPDGYELDINNSQTVTLTSGQDETEIIVTNKSTASILAGLGDYVWFDENRNGVQDPDEAGVNGVTVNLYHKNSEDEFVLINTAVTSDDNQGNPGYYLFDELRPGEYRVEFILPSGYVFTEQYSTNNPTNGVDDSNADPETGFTETIVLGEGEYNLTIDAGLVLPLGKLGDYVWIDGNRNGIQDPKELGINGVTVRLYEENEHGELIQVGEMETGDKDGLPGYYLFEDLEPGNYQVEFELPNGYTFTRTNAGSDQEVDSNVDSQGWTEIIPLAQGEINLTIDAGLVRIITGGGDDDWVPPTNPPRPQDPKDDDKEDSEGNEGTEEGQDGDENDSTTPPATGDGDGDVPGEGSGTDQTGGNDSDMTNPPGSPGSDESGTPAPGQKLPQTGETRSFLPWVGALLCLVGIVLWVKRRSLMVNTNEK